MPEILFYHLERAGLEEVLPAMLERSLERGWKALVCLGSPERVDHLDSHLWTFREDAFLPHGTDSDPRAAQQPVLLTVSDSNLNAANVVFFADGAAPREWTTDALAEFERVVMLFDGRDPGAVEAARAHWKGARATGIETTYWQQSEGGKWDRKA
jgi:DNA polymerase III subunit chi